MENFLFLVHENQNLAVIIFLLVEASCDSSSFHKLRPH
jgi:hypothetical protein